MSPGEETDISALGRLRLSVVDEFTRERLTINAGRQFTGTDVVAVLEELFLIRSRSAYLRSENGPEFALKAVRKWLEESGVGTLFIEPSGLWKNGYVESSDRKLRDECRDGQLFLSLAEARCVADRRRLDYNHHWPHSARDWITPAAFATACAAPDSATLPQHRQEVVT